MGVISYEQARADHKYLWSIGPAYDMTGGYVDSEDLERLLEKPTKATARDCYCAQIQYWFYSGFNDNFYDPESVSDRLLTDSHLMEIAERHRCF